MTTSYESPVEGQGHPSFVGRRRMEPLADVDIGFAAAAVVLGVWSQSMIVACGVGALAMLVRRSVGLAAVCVGVGAIGVLAGTSAWANVQPRTLGEFRGYARMVGDPEPIGGAVRVVLEIEGERFQTYAYGSPKRRLAGRQSGERVWIEGTRARSTGFFVRREQVRHVVGRIVLDRVGDVLVASPLDRVSNRARSQLRETAESTMSGADAALFTGLVIGDDTRQAPATVDDFRAAGLSHLTAVSGQNVVFVLAVAAIGLRRLPTWWRLASTYAVVGWFVVLTRVEPSVLRAGMMAALAATATALGRERTPVRVLLLAVTVLVVVDPLLVWSVGFWLSVGATFGVTAVAPFIARHLAGPTWAVVPIATVLGAQAGVMLPSWLVFHRLPLVSLPANLLAVPVAGFVMLVGIPTGLLAGLAPGAIAEVVMFPSAIGTRWVSTVAHLGARAEPAAPWSAIGWVVVLVVLAVRWRPHVDPPDHRR